MSFAIAHEGRVYADLRLVATLYFRKPHAELVLGLREVFDRFVERAAPAWIGGKRIAAGHDALYAPFDDKLRRRVRNRLDPAKATKHPDERFDLRSGPDEAELPEWRLHYDAQPDSRRWPELSTGTLTLWLPGQEDEVVEWLRPLAFTSGTVGIGLCSHGIPDPSGYAEAVRRWAFAFPNLLLPNSSGARLTLGDRVPDVAWLTLVSSQVLQRCGVSHPSELALGTETTIEEVGGDRFVLATGERDDLKGSPALRTLARALWPAFWVQWFSYGMNLEDHQNICWQLRWILPEGRTE